MKAFFKKIIDYIIKFLKENKFYILFLFFILGFKYFCFTPITVSGSSMYKTLHDRDIMILNIIGYKLNGVKRGDIVIVQITDERIIKRVVGMPGEKIECINNVIYINGKKIKAKGYGKSKDFSFQIPEGEYFVMGDNRDNSLDSRYLGSIKEEQILGKTNLIIFPFDRFGKTD